MPRLLTILLLLCFNGFSVYSSDDSFPDIKGWKLSLIRNVYHQNELYAILGEKAEYYNNCGFSELRLAEYSKKDGNTVFVELYSFNGISGACGVYMSERNPDFEIQHVGTQGLYIRGEMMFFADKYFVKLSDKGTLSTGKDELTGIGKQIAKNLSSVFNWPQPVLLLPEKNKIKNTEEYIPAGFLGYHFFKRVFAAKYDIDNPVTLFILRYDSQEETQELLDMYLGIFKENKVIKVNNFYQVEDLFNGNVLIGVQSGILAGVICYSNLEGGTDLLTEVFGSIP